MEFAGKGVYDSTHGKVDVTPDEAKKHNDIYSTAELKGLDENCEVGMSGTFYFSKPMNQVSTWAGVMVSDKVHLSPSGKGITFLRNGRQYRGILQKEADCFNFKRVS